MLIEFQDSYNTRRWGGLYTNTKQLGKWACGSERSRVHTKLATAGLGRKLSAWAITIQGNNGWCFDERMGTSPKCWNGDGCPSVPVGDWRLWSVIVGKVHIWSRVIGCPIARIHRGLQGITAPKLMNADTGSERSGSWREIMKETSECEVRVALIWN